MSEWRSALIEESRLFTRKDTMRTSPEGSILRSKIRRNSLPPHCMEQVQATYVWWDTFSKALQEIDRNGNSLHWDVLKEKITQAGAVENGNFTKSMASLETDWTIHRRCSWPGRPDCFLLYSVRALWFGCAVFQGPARNSSAWTSKMVGA